MVLKGVILAGGKATRLRPLTKVISKQLLPVYNKPMIYYPLETLIQAGIEDILIVVSRDHAGMFLELLSDGSAFLQDIRKLEGGDKYCDIKLRLSYVIQEEARGSAHAISLAENFADGDRIVVVLGDNIIQDNIKDAVDRYKMQKTGAKIFLKEVDNPQSFGVAEIREDKIIGVVEKPNTPPSNLAVVGIYMYDNQVFDIIRGIKPSERGELETTDVNNYYISRNQMTYEILQGWWGDGGESFDSLLNAGILAANEAKQEK